MRGWRCANRCRQRKGARSQSPGDARAGRRGRGEILEKRTRASHRHQEDGGFGEDCFGPAANRIWVNRLSTTTPPRSRNDPRRSIPSATSAASAPLVAMGGWPGGGVGGKIEPGAAASACAAAAGPRSPASATRCPDRAPRARVCVCSCTLRQRRRQRSHTFSLGCDCACARG